MADLGSVTAQIAKMQKRKTVAISDIMNASNNIDKFHFIKDSKLPALNPKKIEEEDTLKEIEDMMMEEIEEL
jgi:hypothetical protein